MLFNYLFIFMMGSVLGYFLELFYRRIVMKKWVKPGVFKGVYLPLYGMGLCVCYLFYNLDLNFIFKVLFIVLFLTLLELLCGLIFIKYFKVPLWDYSCNFLNYRGLICFKFSVYWGFLGIFCMLLFSFINFNVLHYFLIKLIIFCFMLVLVFDVLYSIRKLFKNRGKG